MTRDRLKIEWLDPQTLVPYDKNAKLHPPEQIESLRRQIREHGFDVPIVVWQNNVIIKGHGRTQAAIEEQMALVPCIKRTDLTEAQARAARIADNKLSESGWDMALLQEEFASLSLSDIDMDLVTFETDERDASIINMKDTDNKTVQDVESFAPPAKPQTSFGDSYQLGGHVLHCGDSAGHIAGFGKYDIVFTDPPYGVDYRARSTSEKRNQYGQIKNDGMSGEALQNLVRSAIPDCSFVFVCCDWKSFADFQAALGKPQSVCVWDKGHFGFGKGYRRQHEFVLFYGTHNRNDLSDIWPFPRASDYQHPTQKPVPLVAKALSDVGQKNAAVYDPFGGSGSTLLAAEQLKMRATLVEFEPRYCDVIISRWEKLTGQTAKLVDRLDVAQVERG